MRRLALSLALLLIVVAPLRADDLYGITRDGALIQIDELTGAARLVRTFPPIYSQFDSLEWANGAFYASYGGGNILRFGLVDGDEVSLGYSGVPAVEALAIRPDGRVFAVVSQNTDYLGWEPRSESLGELNLATGHINIVAQPPNAAVNCVGASFEALVYIDNANFYTFHQKGGCYAEDADGLILAMSAGHQYFAGGQLAPSSTVDWGVLTGLARSPTTGTILGVRGYEPDSNFVRRNIPSILYRIGFLQPDIGEQAIGNTGFQGVTGLSFGPEWDDTHYYGIDEGTIPY